MAQVVTVSLSFLFPLVLALLFPPVGLRRREGASASVQDYCCRMGLRGCVGAGGTDRWMEVGKLNCWKFWVDLGADDGRLSLLHRVPTNCTVATG